MKKIIRKIAKKIRDLSFVFLFLIYIFTFVIIFYERDYGVIEGIFLGFIYFMILIRKQIGDKIINLKIMNELKKMGAIKDYNGLKENIENFETIGFIIYEAVVSVIVLYYLYDNYSLMLFMSFFMTLSSGVFFELYNTYSEKKDIKKIISDFLSLKDVMNYIDKSRLDKSMLTEKFIEEHFNKE